MSSSLILLPLLLLFGLYNNGLQALDLHHSNRILNLRGSGKSSSICLQNSDEFKSGCGGGMIIPEFDHELERLPLLPTDDLLDFLKSLLAFMAGVSSIGNGADISICLDDNDFGFKFCGVDCCSGKLGIFKGFGIFEAE